MKITISGLSGSGKGTLIKKLSNELGYINTRSVGDLQEEIALEKGLTIHELMKLAKKDSSIHTEMDTRIEEYGKQHKDLIVEGRIAYNFIPDSIKIFLDVNKNVAAERIFKDKENRPDEPDYSSVDETLNYTQERLQNAWQGFQNAHGIDFLDKENYDIIIDTSDKSQKEVCRLARMKIVDYMQLMNPPTFYLGHPSEIKKPIRKWEEFFEFMTDINLKNPFFDCNTLETEMSHMGIKKYTQLGKNSAELARGDFEGINLGNVIGGIFILDDSFTWGTTAEMIYTKLMGKLVYSVITHPEEAYMNHPLATLLSDKIFTNKTSLRHYLNENKKNLFRYLEQSKEKVLQDPTFQGFYFEMLKNIKNFTGNRKDIERIYERYNKL